MSEFDIESLVSLLKKGEVSKEELLTNIKQISFQSLPSNLNNSTKDCTLKELLMKAGEQLSNQVAKEYQSIQRNSSAKILQTPSQHSNAKLTPSSKKSSARSPEGSRRNFNPRPPLYSVNTSRKNSDNSKFFKKLESYQLYKESQLKRKEEMMKTARQKECSFAPRINSYASTSKTIARERTSQREHVKDKLKELRLKQEQSKDEMLKSYCTFRPSINARDVQSRYMTTTFTSPLKTSKGDSRNNCNYNQSVRSLRSPFRTSLKAEKERPSNNLRYGELYQSIDALQNILSPSATLDKDEEAKKRNVKFNLSNSRSIPIKEYESARNNLKSSGGKTPAGRNVHVKHNKLQTVQCKDKKPLELKYKTAREEKKKPAKARIKAEFDFDMFKKHSEASKKTNYLISKLHKEISEYKESVAKSSAMSPRNTLGNGRDGTGKGLNECWDTAKYNRK
eukprot:TRINITY_DN477_c0_g1_i3.p1 TRINITY_DN477_c0_g1~~TRINITY_DN477_c0_g1_i3.p1  ORF type:complete len:451 (-),score=132.38 TRINITY_DN477_c0_g1_i3:86-1438(-)